MPKNRTVALDFDGVLHSYVRGFTGVMPKDPPVPGAQKFVEDLILNGYTIVIFSHRAVEPDGQVGIQEWLEKWDFPEGIAVTATKPPAIRAALARASSAVSGFRFWGIMLDPVE